VLCFNSRPSLSLKTSETSRIDVTMRVCHLSLDKWDLSPDSLNEGQVSRVPPNAKAWWCPCQCRMPWQTALTRTQGARVDNNPSIVLLVFNYFLWLPGMILSLATNHGLQKGRPSSENKSFYFTFCFKGEHRFERELSPICSRNELLLSARREPCGCLLSSCATQRQIDRPMKNDNGPCKKTGLSAKTSCFTGQDRFLSCPLILTHVLQGPVAPHFLSCPLYSVTGYD